jgi:hypothetical protein
MRFSNDAASWSNWENYSATKAWIIASSNGIQTVYVQFGDSAGLDSQVYSDRINFVTASATYPINTPKVATPNTPKVATPTFSPIGGTYSSGQNVMLSCSTVGATIHFTIDGSEPSSLSPTFFTSILVKDTTTIKAKAFKMWMTDSDTASATYTTNTIARAADTIPADPLLINYAFSVIAIVAIVSGVLLLWHWRASKQRQNPQNDTAEKL